MGQTERSLAQESRDRFWLDASLFFKSLQYNVSYPSRSSCLQGSCHEVPQRNGSYRHLEGAPRTPGLFKCPSTVPRYPITVNSISTCESQWTPSHIQIVDMHIPTQPLSISSHGSLPSKVRITIFLTRHRKWAKYAALHLQTG